MRYVSILRVTLVSMLVLAYSLPMSPSATAGAETIESATTPVDDDLTIVMVPPLSGAVFEFDGRSYTTGAAGTIVVPGAGDLHDMSNRLTFDHFEGDPTISVVLTRFAGLVNANRTRSVQAVFETTRDVSFAFLDLDARPVDLERITSMTLRNSLGVRFELDTIALTGTVVLPASRALQSRGGYVSKEIYYTVQDVVIDGTNTVNRSQQKFYPSEADSVDVETQFYHVVVSVSDALFGFDNGSAALVRWPDGRETRHEVSGGTTRLYLPRGSYEMRVDGSGLALWRPVSVSRDQTIGLELFSTVDIIALVGVVVVFATGLILIGRRRQRAMRVGARSVAESEVASRDLDGGVETDDGARAEARQDDDTMVGGS